MRLPHLLAILVCGVLIVVAIILSKAPSESAPSAPASEPALPDASALPLEVFSGQVRDTLGPVTYFVDNCARCHGSMETAYQEFPKPRHGEELRKMLVVMSNGPALAPLDDAGLQQQYDLHLSILARKPYVWIDPEASDVLAVETMPDAVVTLITPTKRIQAASDLQHYLLPREPGILTVRWMDKTTTVPLSK